MGYLTVSLLGRTRQLRRSCNGERKTGQDSNPKCGKGFRKTSLTKVWIHLTFLIDSLRPVSKMAGCIVCKNPHDTSDIQQKAIFICVHFISFISSASYLRLVSWVYPLHSWRLHGHLRVNETLKYYPYAIIKRWLPESEFILSKIHLIIINQ